MYYVLLEFFFLIISGCSLVGMGVTGEEPIQIGVGVRFILQMYVREGEREERRAVAIKRIRCLK